MKVLLVTLVVLFSQVSFAANDCFLQRQVRNFRALDHSTLEIDAGRKDYVVKVGYCRELNWAHRIAFDTFGSTRVCRGDMVLILDNFSDHIIDRCRIHSIEEIK